VDHTTLRGRIVSWSEAADNKDQGNRGGRSQEDFVITKHSDGSRILRAFCELYEHNLLRDVVLAMDANYRPLDCYVRVMVDDTLQGMAWFRFTETAAQCEAYTVREGRMSQDLPMDKFVPTFATHAVQSDAWLLARYDLTQGPGRQYFQDIPLCSSEHVGKTGPYIMSISSPIEYIGEEKVNVRAGTFVTHHFRFVDASNGHPPYDLWTSADDNYLFVKALVGGNWNTAFELVELERD